MDTLRGELALKDILETPREAMIRLGVKRHIAHALISSVPGSWRENVEPVVPESHSLNEIVNVKSEEKYCFIKKHLPHSGWQRPALTPLSSTTTFSH